MLDLNRAKQRVQQLQNKRKDFSKFTYSLQEGEQTLRFIVKEGEDWPFHYGSIYYRIAKQFFISPTMYEEEDPIMDVLKKMLDSKTEDDVVFAKKYLPARRVFALAVIREQEEKGAVWVDFPAKIEKEVLNYVFDPEYIEMQKELFEDDKRDHNGEMVDFTDRMFGVDFVIKKIKSGASGFPEYEVKPARRTKPFSKLAKTEDEMDKIIEETPDFKEAYRHFSTEEIKKLWDKFLNDDTSDDDEPKEEEIVEEEKLDVASALAKFREKKLK